MHLNSVYKIAVASPPLIGATSVRANLVFYSRKISRYFSRLWCQDHSLSDSYPGYHQSKSTPQFLLFSCQKYKMIRGYHNLVDHYFGCCKNSSLGIVSPTLL